jgi:dihydroxynaphthoic acid synthetase
LDYGHITYQTADGIARITIDRPRKYNAYNSRTLAELRDAYERVARDDDVGVVVLTGSGDKAFCAGGDIEWEAEGNLEGYKADAECKALYAAMRSCLRPTIARVNGYAIGGGNHLAYFCDFTIAAEHAIFGQNGARVGSPAYGWIVGYSVRVLGAKRARELWMLCRRYSAQQALAWGLVNSVVSMDELDAEVQRWCEELLALSPTVIKILKKDFDDEYVQLREFQDSHDYLQEINPNFFASGEQREGALAFLEKRRPNFSKWRA